MLVKIINGKGSGLLGTVEEETEDGYWLRTNASWPHDYMHKPKEFVRELTAGEQIAYAD